MRFIWRKSSLSCPLKCQMSERLSLPSLLFKLPRDVTRQNSSLPRLFSCSPTSSNSRRSGGSSSKQKESPVAKLDHSFQLLGVTKDDCTVEQIRTVYIDLVKQYHPDSRTPQASAERFAEIRDAYKRCMSYAKNVAMSREIYAAMEEELRDIDQRLGFTKQRRLPHRQYLTYDVGPGTYSQRQKAYGQHRLYEAMDNVYEKQFEKALRNPDAKEVGAFQGKTKKHKPTITQTLERIALEKIRDSMGKGEFKNLRGKGKPLQTDHDNPVIDDMQQKLNRLLSNAGFAPEWISLDKEIRHSIEKVNKQLITSWTKCGPHPMTPEKKKKWENELEELSLTVRTINKKINNLNLIVPSLTAQRMHVRLEWLVARVTATPPSVTTTPPSVKDSDLSVTWTELRTTRDTCTDSTEANESGLTHPPASSAAGWHVVHRLVNSTLKMFSTLYDSWRRKN